MTINLIINWKLISKIFVFINHNFNCPKNSKIQINFLTPLLAPFSKNIFLSNIHFFLCLKNINQFFKNFRFFQ